MKFRHRGAAASTLLLCACSNPFQDFSVVPPEEVRRAPAIVDADARLAAAREMPGLTRVELLEDAPRSSWQLLRVTDRVEPHLHTRSAETVYVLRGGGDLLIDQQWQSVRAGMLIHLPMGVPHAFVNRDPEGTLVLVAFTPEYVEGDRVLLEERSPAGD